MPYTGRPFYFAMVSLFLISLFILYSSYVSPRKLAVLGIASPNFQEKSYAEIDSDFRISVVPKNGTTLDLVDLQLLLAFNMGGLDQPAP